ncbi:MAG: two-component sensor histidine kinase [Proteobacteria bacterium]|nr:two-component sensor histidine kinase [Pseudomonadota bacterium]
MSLAPALAFALAGALGGLLWWRRRDPARPTRPAAAPATDLAEAVFEQASQPLLIVQGNRVARANAAARAALGAHVVGQDPRVGLRHPEAIRLLDAAADGSVDAPGLLGGRTQWQLTRRTLAEGCWLVELSDRTAEADVSRAHTDFVANASHELRTPLAAIIGYAETLADAGPALDEATARRFTAIIGREAQRMLTLVDDLMTLSHVEAEKHERPGEMLDLGQLAARVVAEVSSLRGKERVTLEPPTGGLVVAGDAGQLEQALRNLIDNALKYGAPDQPVTVSASPAGGRVVLAVRDRGPGIAPEHLPHLTRRFYRTDPGRSRASGGTGLGLAIVKHIVERHGGELEIASTLGDGTRVSLTLPAAAA